MATETYLISSFGAICLRKNLSITEHLICITVALQSLRLSFVALFLDSHSRLGSSCFSPCAHLLFRKPLACASIGDRDTGTSTAGFDVELSGEDSAAFYLSELKISSWIYFPVILGVAIFVLNVAWIDNSTGFAKAIIDAVSGISKSH